MGFTEILAISIGFPLAIAAAAGALGQARAIAASVEGMARQPEAAGGIRTAMIIGLALIETLVIYVLLICFMLYFKFPQQPATQYGAGGPAPAAAVH
jgi:F-type H+-transporting ATPase subunit c